MITETVLPLSDASGTLETIGGKGLSLTRMIRAGFPVPDGFHITTEAYRRYITANGLQPYILAALEEVSLSLPETLENASANISQRFHAGIIPPDLAHSITRAYAQLNGAAVAVRSSATAEDLPEASFAGQQETFLNVQGEVALLMAVKKCWASLWTARAIAYRLKNNIDQERVALAVVVEKMIPAEAAGIVFTANPVNGHRDEMVINAAWGLGEAIVSGAVSPDTIVIDKASGKVKSMNIAEKTLITVLTATGTVEKPLLDTRRKTQVLKPGQVSELASIARKIELFYGAPQDIEWCQVDGQLFILQARPITALPEPEVDPPAEWKLPKGSYAAMRNNIVELMGEPLSPLFATLGLSAVNSSLHRWMDESFAMGGIMPAEIILVVNHYAYNNGSISARSIGRLFFGAGKIMKKMFTGAVERWTEMGRPHYYGTVQSWQATDWRSFPAVTLVNSARQLTEAAIDAYAALVSGVIPAAWMTEALFTRVYDRLVRRRGDPAAPTFLLGFDSLPIRSDKSLFRLAEWAHNHPSLRNVLEKLSTSQLAAYLLENNGWPDEVEIAIWEEWRSRFLEHLQQYGHTLYDLDFAHPLPADDPSPVIDTFKLYLRKGGADPFLRQQELARQREEAQHAVVQRLKGLRLKWFNKTLASAQKYAPLREEGLGEVGLAYPLIRKILRELGRRFHEQMIIPVVDDIFWLTQDEVQLYASLLDAEQPVESLAEIIPQRKAEYRAAQRVNPPMALPQMKVFGFDLMSLKKKRGRGGKGDLIRGVATSPGRVTGPACVLHGPEDFSRMRPGDVLVAAITTPAWTPLFVRAAAVVTDVGGPLSHGSIVAREYGIPAVLGTGVATRRIQNGQTVTVDGSTGVVLLGKNGNGR